MLFSVRINANIKIYAPLVEVMMLNEAGLSCQHIATR